MFKQKNSVSQNSSEKPLTFIKLSNTYSNIYTENLNTNVPTDDGQTGRDI
jgi:hypothetical protein